jgi:hypothetical protein
MAPRCAVRQEVDEIEHEGRDPSWPIADDMRRSRSSDPTATRSFIPHRRRQLEFTQLRLQRSRSCAFSVSSSALPTSRETCRDLAGKEAAEERVRAYGVAVGTAK